MNFCTARRRLRQDGYHLDCFGKLLDVARVKELMPGRLRKFLAVAITAIAIAAQAAVPTCHHCKGRRPDNSATATRAIRPSEVHCASENPQRYGRSGSPRMNSKQNLPAPYATVYQAKAELRADRSRS